MTGRSGRNIKKLAGAEFVDRAIFHGRRRAAGEYKSDVLDVAARRTHSGADVNRPLPSGLVRGATDGHAKNFSLFLGPGGRFHLTPFYDVVSAQPSLDARHIERKQMKMAMSVGNSRHYRVDDIQGRHFLQTTAKAGLPESLAIAALDEITHGAGAALEAVENQLPHGFPETLHLSVRKGLLARLKKR